jgi:hypothetical protein
VPAFRCAPFRLSVIRRQHDGHSEPPSTGQARVAGLSATAMPTHQMFPSWFTVQRCLCQLIRQHQLDATLVKSYATDFCGVKTLREATREQIEAFVAHLADWAEKDRNALLCQLNSYPIQKEGAA